MDTDNSGLAALLRNADAGSVLSVSQPSILNARFSTIISHLCLSVFICG
jgi:hypothetical protein